jgi:hypothetical protein
MNARIIACGASLSRFKNATVQVHKWDINNPHCPLDRDLPFDEKKEWGGGTPKGDADKEYGVECECGER